MALFGKQKNTAKKPAPSQNAKKAATRAVKGAAPSSGLSASEILLRPRITEKATLGIERRVYVFEVDPRANKKEVARAVKEIFSVEPRKVNIVRMRPRPFVSRLRGRRGIRAGFKKAYVYLEKGASLDIMK